MSGFRDVTGHERTIEHLKNAIASGRVSQAYLLVGDKGDGKENHRAGICPDTAV
jgi:DNA polymerase-3 subunit delta'